VPVDQQPLRHRTEPRAAQRTATAASDHDDIRVARQKEQRPGDRPQQHPPLHREAGLLRRGLLGRGGHERRGERAQLVADGAVGGPQAEERGVDDAHDKEPPVQGCGFASSPGHCRTGLR